MSSNVSSKRVKHRRGDLFEFCAADGRLGYGVVLSPGGVLNAIFFRTLHASRPPTEVIAEDGIALIGTTMDALFYHGRWTVIGHDFPIPDGLPFPNWKESFIRRTSKAKPTGQFGTMSSISSTSKQVARR
jgi:hypothetical protein